MTRMRAAVITAPGHCEVHEVPLPKPARGEVRVRLEGSGVCGSDLALWQGLPWLEYPREPGTPGHEAWGRVDAVGEGVTGFKPGQRVTGFFTRAYAEYDVAKAGELMLIPEALGDAPFPGEPLACAVNAFHRSDVQEGQTVAVIGAGFLGALLTRLCADAGADVIAVSRRSFALKTAERMGARHLIDFGDDQGAIVSDVERLTGNGLCDRVIEVTGKQAPLDLAAKLTRTRGRLVVAGYHQDGPRTVDMQLWNWRGLDVINAHERDPQVYMRGMREAADLIAAGRLDPSPLYTHEVSLDDLGHAFRLMQDRPDGFVKTLVRP